MGIDVINFAHPDNVPKLQALVQSANNSDNSHFLDVPIGVAMITDVLITSPILMEEGAGDAPMAEGGAPGNIGEAAPNRFAEYGGFNPEMDPDLAMAMKISLDEMRANQKANEEKKPEEPKANEVADEESEHDEQYYLDLAMKMSMEPDANEAQAQEKPAEVAKQPAADLKDIISTDFMQGLISDMKLDIDAEAMEDILNAANGQKKEEPKKDEENKDSERK